MSALVAVKPLLVREKDLPAITGFKRTMIRQLIARGQFPTPMRVGARGSAWRTADIERWVEQGCGKA